VKFASRSHRSPIAPRPSRFPVPLRKFIAVAMCWYLRYGLRRGHYELASEAPRQLRVAAAFTELANAI